VFDYPAKSGQRRVQAVGDDDVYEVLRALKRRRGGGDALLAYRQNGGWTDVRSSEINAYIKELTNADVSAKDFRTWHANLLAATALAVSVWQESRSGREQSIKHAVREAAHYLGNTPSVCRASYIDPRLFDHYRSGNTVAPALQEAALEEGTLPGETVERALIALLEEPPSRTSGRS
jgi:DNA topoisomerase IB